MLTELKILEGIVAVPEMSGPEAETFKKSLETVSRPKLQTYTCKTNYYTKTMFWTEA